MRRVIVCVCECICVVPGPPGYRHRSQLALV